MVTRKKKSPRTRSARTEDQILEAARHVLTRSGENALSMRAIAKRVGITPAAIYRHFGSRGQLVQRVVEDSLDSWEQTLWRTIEPLPVGSLDRILALGQAYIEFAETEHFNVLFTPGQKPRRLDEIPGRAGLDVLQRCVEQAMEAGVVRRSDPVLVSLFLWSRVHGIAMLAKTVDLSREHPALVERSVAEALFSETGWIVREGLTP